MTPPYSLRLKVPHFHPEVYARAIQWLNARGTDTVNLETNSGITYLNGTIYISNIVFKHDEDRLMFVLTFPELV